MEIFLKWLQIKGEDIYNKDIGVVFIQNIRVGFSQVLEGVEFRVEKLVEFRVVFFVFFLGYVVCVFQVFLYVCRIFFFGIDCFFQLVCLLYSF